VSVTCREGKRPATQLPTKWCETRTWGGVSKHAGRRPSRLTCCIIIMLLYPSTPGACALRLPTTFTVAHLHTPWVLGLRSLLLQTPGAARGGVPPP
jgi:hypothetical protein